MRKFGVGAVMTVSLLALAACGKKDGEAEKAAAPAAPAAESPADPSDSIQGLPRPKTGNWKIQPTMAGMQLPATTVCYTEEIVSSDKWAQGIREDSGVECSEQRTRMEGGAVVSHSVCTVEGRTMTTDVRAEGDFQSRYTTTMTTTTEPLPPGMKNPTVMTVTAERVGDC